MRGRGVGRQWSVEAVPQDGFFQMEALLVSSGLVAIAEIGDKTQLLAIMLAARFRRPIPIIFGILVATLANHALAAFVGELAGAWLNGPWMRWILGIAFLAFAVWALVPDKLDEGEAPPALKARSILLTTAIAFFLVEMGDKTQVATIALGARFQNVALVATGTTIGMMLANVPAVLLGEAAATKLPLKYIRWAAAVGFAGIGAWILIMG
jgi:putative Ca2+/H+ antiporter (TMEM165/GDT1 family)